VGSKDNPPDRRGLAHFLEHMLFLGTDRYPEPGEYQQFISDHGGQHNAYTADDNTNYFFDIDPGELEPALDRFSRFFVAPLLNEEYVAREKNAVDSEYRAYIRNEYRRMVDVVSQVANPDNPYLQFDVGNLASLSGDNLRDDVLGFYQEHYSANLMTLVVLGREDLDQLGRWVEDKFSPVPNRRFEERPTTEPLFRAGTLPLRLDIRPDKDIRELGLSFPLPDLTGYRYDKPMQYVGDVLGHEGEGSLYQFLREQGWAEALSAGMQLDYLGGAMFGVNVSLTPEGVKHVDDIIGYVFHTLALLRDGGITERRFRELQNIARLHFDFQQATDEVHYVRQLAVQLGDYEPADALIGPYLLRDYRPDVIASLLDQLVPGNMLVTLTAPEVETNLVTDLYRVEYAKQPVSVQMREQWTSATTDRIYLPLPNVFLPESTDRVAAAAPGAPRLLETRREVALWYGQSDLFELPRGTITVSLETPLAMRSARDAALNALFVALVSERLNPKVYPANLVDLNSAVIPSRRGVTVSISGLSDKQGELLGLVLDELVVEEFSPARFAILREQLVRGWRNAEREPPYQVLMQEQQHLLYVPWYSPAALADAAEMLAPADLAEFLREFHAGVNVVAMVYGNFTEADARSVADVIRDRFPRAAGDVDMGIGVVQLPSGKHYWRQLDLPHEDTAVVHYFQGASDSNRDRVLMGLTAQVLRPGYFNDLRTEQQFGYVVYASPMVLERTPGLVLVVQSPGRSADDIVSASWHFLQNSGDAIMAMTPAQFDQHRATLIELLTEPPRNIDEQAARFWDQLQQGYTGFDRNDQLVAALQALRLDEWQQFYRQRFTPEAGAELVLVSPGGRATGVIAAAASRVESALQFKTGVAVKKYP